VANFGRRGGGFTAQAPASQLFKAGKSPAQKKSHVKNYILPILPLIWHQFC
jgi:hypothetical protein